ncbi:LOW QUALITY PROTEIN: hypothetical protein CVT25_014302 [Psilocybe cyanescens]|uniref:LIM zinc-binding domain-containing protein n=1 Tax=Psilocybe cyanescens TaxID=93625 RepID=A0A409XKZ4_PSICY|nr:LOW QUALITY PROTEIN: hypothetical protein CVT25_014302 [Psilocybe cyanescens]
MSMIASLLSTSSSTSSNNDPPAGRISQLLPSVKCSTCHQPVPLAELGDHTCTAPPPVPSLPKPAFTPEAATALLPDRLQSRVANGSLSASSSSGNFSGPSPSRAPPPQSPAPTPSSSSTSRLRINVNTKGPPSPTQPSFLPRSSPLARADSSQSTRTLNDSRSPQTREPPYSIPPSSSSNSHSYASSSSAASSPLRTRPPGSGPDRMRTPSNAGSLSNQSTPATARPGTSFPDSPSTTPVQPGRPIPNNNVNSTPRGPPAIGIPFPTSSPYPNRTGSAPPLNVNNNPNGNYRPGPQTPGGGGPQMGRPSQPSHSISEPNFSNNSRQEFVPAAERGIDTKTGGAAGMAGVGRRGFAAAARAAMFVNAQAQGPGAMQPNGDRGMGMRPMGPQPQGQRPGLGPGPGPGPGQLQGQGQQGQGYDQYNRRPLPPPNMAPRLLDTDSISRFTHVIHFISFKIGRPPMSPVAQPELPSSISASKLNYGAGNPNMPPPMSPLPRTPASALPNGNGNGNTLARTATSASTVSSSSSSLSFSLPPSKQHQREKSIDRAPPSPIESESEYGGLAYADSTDYEDDEEHEGRRRMMSRSRSRSASRRSASESRSGSLARNRLRDSSERGSSPPPPSSSSQLPPPSTSTATSASKAALPDMLRKISTSSSGAGGGMQFGSVSVRTRSRSRSQDRGGMGMGARIAASVSGSSLSGSISRPRAQAGAGAGGAHSRDTSASASSAYSSGDEGLKERAMQARARTNSAAAIAQALGLSQTPPSEYARLGGPGVGGGGPGGPGGAGGRSRSLKRDGVLGSASGSLRRDGGAASVQGSANGSLSGSVKREDGKNGYEKTERERRRDGSITSGADLQMQRERERERENGDEERRGRMLRNNNMSIDIRAATEGAALTGTSGGGGAKTQRSNTVQGMQSPDAAQKPIKLPTRSLTSPQLDRDKLLGGASASASALASAAAGGSRAGSDGSARAGARKTARRPKTCLRCAKAIENGRWISVDSGGVLCESCWKNMYLPKCRRCSLPIEKQAVSSSDGQLKGKYHKECFNCHICHKPFPDQSFYVYDGHPLCAYHYHEANDSLCAAARCGQPIEGPCAVSHTGDRYHPEHMTCEHPGREPCRVRLDEYWEVDGRMLCERHAAAAGRSGGMSGSGSEGEGEGAGREGEREEWERRRDLRAMKRVTRFIDLAGGDGLGLGAAAGAGAGAGSRESESGLR